MSYQQAKNALLSVRRDIRFFTRAAFDVIQRDRATARRIAAAGGDVSEFFKNAETVRGAFYQKNGGCYCALLEILSAAGC